MTTPVQIAATDLAWQQLDMGLVREGFAREAERGISHLLIAPPWHLLQPSARQIDRVLMAHLEQLFDAAQAVKLQVIPALLSVRRNGMLMLPDWHNGPDAIGWLTGRTRQPVRTTGTLALINDRVQPLNLADPYATESWRTAQLLLLRTVIGYFDGHAAVSHWHIGDGWSRLADTTEHHAEAWIQAVHTTIRRVAPVTPLMTTVDGPNLLGHTLTVERLARFFDVLLVDCAMPEIPQRSALRLSTPATVLIALVAGLGQRPVVAQLAPLVADGTRHWEQIVWHQQQLTIAHLPAEDVERYYETVIGVLRQNGAAGVVYPVSAAATGHNRHTQMQHIPNWDTVAPQTETIDAERFRHNPLRAFAQLWRDV